MGIFTAISNAFGAIMQYFNWASKRSDLNNAPDVRQARINIEEQREQDKAKKAIANEDTKRIQELLSE